MYHKSFDSRHCHWNWRNKLYYDEVEGRHEARNACRLDHANVCFLYVKDNMPFKNGNILGVTNKLDWVEPHSSPKYKFSFWSYWTYPHFTCPYFTCLCPDLTCSPDLTCHDFTCPHLTCPDFTWPILTWPVLTWPFLTWLDLTWPDLTWPELTCPDFTCPYLFTSSRQPPYIPSRPSMPPSLIQGSISKFQVIRCGGWVGRWISTQ